MTVRIITGDCREVLKTLPDNSVHCCTTSPPYWSLRDYGVARQIGLESTYQEFIAEMVTVFREVRRVLRADGVAWVNMGDSYANDGKWGGATGGKHCDYLHGGEARIGREKRTTGLKPKDLCGIPWRVAFALQADGWWLRQDIIWSKPNPMPESVTDRCTKAHEYLFMLSKAEHYYYDQEAIKEPAIYSGLANQDDSGFKDPRSFNGKHRDGYRSADKRRGHGRRHAGFNDRWDEMERKDQCGGMRNKRSVWEVATQPFSEAHFATFPPALIEPCILAGTSAKGCCAKCGAPWMRETKQVGGKSGKSWHDHSDDLVQGQRGGASGFTGPDRRDYESYSRETIGWSPSCTCSAAVVPCSVLDPFFGTGTTGLVADRLQRDCVGIELNPEYAAMAQRRIMGETPLFSQVAAE